MVKEGALLWGVPGGGGRQVELGPREVLGEEVLISEAPRSPGVGAKGEGVGRAKGQVQLLRLDVDKVSGFVGGELEAGARDAFFGKCLQAIPAGQGKLLGDVLTAAELKRLVSCR